MKMIVAFIKPDRLMDVTLALQEIDRLSGVSVSEVRGFGRGRGTDNTDRLRQVIDFLPRVRIEIVCADELVERVVGAIERQARTGLRGDGKIFVSDVEAAVRISTGERGNAAI